MIPKVELEAKRQAIVEEAHAATVARWEAGIDRELLRCGEKIIDLLAVKIDQRVLSDLKAKYEAGGYLVEHHFHALRIS